MHLDRLARSVPDARDIDDSLIKRDVKRALGTRMYDPTDPVGKLFFTIAMQSAGLLAVRP